MASEIAFMHCLSCAALCKSERKTTLLVVTVPLKCDSSQLHFNHSQDETVAENHDEGCSRWFYAANPAYEVGQPGQQGPHILAAAQLQFNYSRNEMVAENHNERCSRCFYAANPAYKAANPASKVLTLRRLFNYNLITAKANPLSEKCFDAGGVVSEYTANVQTCTPCHSGEMCFPATILSEPDRPAIGNLDNFIVIHQVRYRVTSCMGGTP